MGIWPFLQGLFGLGGTIGGLGAATTGLQRLLGLGQPIYDDLIQPGAPGTGWNWKVINALPSEAQSGMVSLFNEWGRTPAGRDQAIAYLTQLTANKEAQDYMRGRTAEMEDMARGSPGYGWMDTLAGYAPKVTGLADSLGTWGRDWESGVRSGQSDFARTADTRAAAYDTRGAALGGKIEALGDTLASAAKKRLANPNVMSQAEMDAVVSRMIGSTNEAARRQAAATEQAAAARGIGPAAMAALQAQNQAANYRANLENVANVVSVNAANRIPMFQAASGALGTAGDIYGRAGQTEALYNQMADTLLTEAARRGLNVDQLLAQVMPGIAQAQAGMYGTAGGLLGAATEGRLNLDKNLEAMIMASMAANQPLDFATLGDMAAATRIGQAEREYSGLAGLANLMSGSGMGMFNLLDSTLNRKAIMDAQSGGRRNWGGLGIGAGAGLGTLFGALYGEPLVGAQIGSLIGGGIASPW